MLASDSYFMSFFDEKQTEIADNSLRLLCALNFIFPFLAYFSLLITDESG